MKNIFLTAILFLGLNAIAQKTVTILNNTPYDLQIGTIASTYTAGLNPPTYGFPFYTQKTFTPTASFITVPSGGTYILQNTSTVNFPFSSPASVPLITQWYKTINGTTPATTVTSATAYTAGAQQVFGYLKFQLIDPATGATVGTESLGTRRGATAFLPPVTPVSSCGCATSVTPSGTGGNYLYNSPNALWSVSVSTVPAYNPLTPNASYRTVFSFF